MNERQIANMLGRYLRQRDFAWSRISTDAIGVPCTIDVHTKDDEDGSAATYCITVTKEDELEGEEPKTKDDVWVLKNPQHAHSGFPMEVTVRSKFRDGGEGYVTYAATSSQSMRTHAAGIFIERYRMKPKYVTGGLYWSWKEKAFCLYQGSDKLVIKFLTAKTDAGMGLATMSSEMPEDAQLANYSDGSQFTLTHRPGAGTT